MNTPKNKLPVQELVEREARGEQFEPIEGESILQRLIARDIVLKQEKVVARNDGETLWKQMKARAVAVHRTVVSGPEEASYSSKPSQPPSNRIRSYVEITRFSDRPGKLSPKVWRVFTHRFV